MQQKVKKKYFLYEIMALEVVARKSAYCDGNS